MASCNLAAQAPEFCLLPFSQNPETLLGPIWNWLQEIWGVIFFFCNPFSASCQPPHASHLLKLVRVSLEDRGPLWYSGLRFWRGHCSSLACCHGSCSIPGLQTAMCRGCGQKKKKRILFALFAETQLPQAQSNPGFPHFCAEDTN